MKKIHVKTGDSVIVITGKDKGKKGKVLEVQPAKCRVIVEGVNLIKKHVRPSQQNPEGGILTQEAYIDASNVMHIDPKSGKPTRIGHKEVNGKKVRIAKKSGEVID